MAYQWKTLSNGWRILTFRALERISVLHGLVTRYREIHGESLRWAPAPLFRRSDRGRFRSELEQVRRDLDVADWPMILLHQVHGSRILWNPAPDAEPEQADGALTDRAEVLIAITVADCLPIWIVDPALQVVGLVHAGWRGTLAGVLERALEMVLEQGSDLSATQIVLGPGIQKCCYHVGIDVIEAVSERYPDLAAYVLEPRRGLWFLDLVGLNILQARNMGLRRSQIHPVRFCTRCNPHWFYSHRRGDTGRMLAFVGRNL